MQEADYMSFRRSQDERQKIYRGEANFRTPLKVVENDFGYLIFSGNEIGKEGFRECLQHIIDHYFDPHYDIGHLGVYEYPYVTEELAAHIDASYRIDHARQLNNSFEFQRENHVPQSKLPDKFINGLTPLFTARWKRRLTDLWNWLTNSISIRTYVRKSSFQPGHLPAADRDEERLYEYS